MSGRPAAFLDRDGVLNEDRGYVHRWEDFAFLPGVIDALRRLQQKGYLLVVITNQSAVARGLCAETDVLALHERMRAFLHGQGIELAGIYYCPHHPQGSVARYTRACACRKPEPGMILRAAQEHGIDLARSLLVGDKISDLEAGRAAGIPSLYLVVPPGQEK
ncbi:MAG: D-glycero-beta-D-manno-heptose 1,7-bisphosphate 7-phosphatase, partial [Tepidiphilus sp.]|nr:D-glycero-beta-D-manno-heptose 1,7-bisphosphate 7-phosphatase [Tepidiphilus sp.]